MRSGTSQTIKYFLTTICLLLCSGHLWAQSSLSTGNPNQPTTLSNAPQRDTNANKSNTSKWKNTEARIYYKKLNSEKTYYPDTSLHTFHQRPFSDSWNTDLGNLGSASQNLLFHTEERLGPTLGYHIFDIYKFQADSINYYNTTRPYTAFTYQLGSMQEQMVRVTHTQNIRPYWNFSFDYRKVNSPGYYKDQQTNHDNVSLATNYKSPNLHYQLHGVLIYNKLQQDENGGITDQNQLDSSQYIDRKTLNVRFQRDDYSITRSVVTNMLRDFTTMLNHSYTWGRYDTVYNSDSTKYTSKLVPRFRITHQLTLSTEKHQYKDILPDSMRYTGFFEHSFTYNQYSQYNTTRGDSVISQQKWFWVENSVSINGFFGKEGQQLEFDAGIGNRYDQFSTVYGIGSMKNNIISNYLTGQIKKEALQPGQWFYHANTKFFLTGDAAGDFLINGVLGKELKNNWGTFSAGFQQQLRDAPYNYTTYANQYITITKSFNKESVSQLYASLYSNQLKLSANFSNYLIDNYIYINEAQQAAQYKDPFNLTQVSVKKIIKLRNFYLDNELAYQQLSGTAPVNVPAILGRHQLSYESSLFKKALRIATGIGISYYSNYHPAGYDPFLSRFYYQNSYTTNNAPEACAFFNFRIKRFRAYIMGDQLQQIFVRNKINYPGYPSQNAMLRFGFTWVMIN